MDIKTKKHCSNQLFQGDFWGLLNFRHDLVVASEILHQFIGSVSNFLGGFEVVASSVLVLGVLNIKTQSCEDCPNAKLPLPFPLRILG